MFSNSPCRFGRSSILCATATCALMSAGVSHFYAPVASVQGQTGRAYIGYLNTIIPEPTGTESYRMDVVNSVLRGYDSASIDTYSDDAAFAEVVSQQDQADDKAENKTSDTTLTHQTIPLESKGLNFTPVGYIDTHLRMGNKRSLGSSEIFYPFAWNGRFLGFADIRLTAATNSSIEGNIGVGIRRLNDNHTGIFGLYGYLDQRKTEYDNQFTQMTLGSEWLADKWEARVNAYLPLSGKRTSLEAAPTTFVISGTGIVANGGNNIITETPNRGFDVEFGRKLPLMEFNYLKGVWAYVGGYHFSGDGTPSINGYRLRTKLDITDRLSIGGEWRQDNIRKDEMVIEARLKFPFGETEKTKALKPSGIYERLTQQPERDVDIVVQNTNKSATTSANVMNTDTGTQQRILTVDNRAAAGGDGSTAHPYNTLATAQAAAANGDIIYVTYGDGTSTGMSNGLTLNKDWESLVGSGVALTYDSSRMHLAGGGFSIPDGTVILGKGLSPILTNVAANSDILTITGDNILVSGVTLNNATRHGVNISVAGAGNNINGTILRNMDIVTPISNGINVSATTSAVIDALTLDGVKVDNSGAVGVSLTATGANSTISNFSMLGTNLFDSHTVALQGTASAGGDIISSTISNSNITAAGDNGIYFLTTGAGSTLNNLTVDNVVISDAGTQAVYLLTQSGGYVSNPHISNTTISSAGDAGIYALLQNAGSQMTGLSITNTNVSRSATDGISVQAQAGTSVTNSTFAGLVLDRNRDNGLTILTTGAASTIDNTTLSNVTVKNSGLVGALLQATTTGHLTNTAINNLVASGNSGNGLQITSSTSSALVSHVTVQNAEISDNRATGVFVQDASTGTMSDINFTGINITDSSDNGMVVSSTAAGSVIDGLSISNLNISDTGLLGLSIAASTAGQITNTTLSNTNISDAGTNGLQVTAAGTAATIDNMTFTNTTIDNAGGTGAFGQVTTTGVINHLTFAGLNISNSSDNGLYINTQSASSQFKNFSVSDLKLTNTQSGEGLYIYAQSGSLVQNGTISGVSIDGAGDRGIYLISETTGTLVDNLHISDATVNDTAFDGLRLYASTGGDMTNIGVSSTSITDAGENGIYLQSTTAGSILSGVTFSHVTVTGSAATGVYVQGTTSGELSVSLDHVTSTGNHDYGVYVDDDTTSPYTLDMGGGTLSSAGGNRIYNNYLQEMRLDYDGANMLARNNWWGSSSGLTAAERILEVSSTIDTTGFLTTDPGP